MVSPPLALRNRAVIRTATQDDAEGICAVHARSVRELARVAYTPAQITRWVDGRRPVDYRDAIGRGETFFVAELDRQIVGFASLLRREVRAVYVTPEGQGNGGRLLMAVEAEARARGLTALDVHATLNAADFYRHHGYEGDDEVEITLPGGCRIASIVMHKRLRPDV